MVKLLAVIFVIFLLKHIHCRSLWDAPFPEVSDVTLEKGKPIRLPKNYTKVQIQLFNGTIYSDSLSQLGVSELRIGASETTKIEDGALCSSPTLKLLEIDFTTRTNSIPALTKNIFENCTQLEELLVIYNPSNCPYQIDHNALESMSSLKALSLKGYNVIHLKKDFLKIPNTLTILVLAFCGIQEIDSNTFEDLNNLETIELIYNRHLKKIPKGLFKNTPKLKTLSLSDNNIQDLTWDEFEGLANLEVLNVAQNRISSFDADKIATNFPNLKKINIDLNPPSCNEQEAVANQLKTKLKTLVEVKYKLGEDFYHPCKQDSVL
jgi:Leucine-rich repeat (LRR) protein